MNYKNENIMLHTKGNRVFNASGENVRLLGVNRAGLEWESKDRLILDSVKYACDEWNCNIIRIPVAQDRWFGFAPEQQNDDISGEKYRELVDEIANALLEKEKYMILDLHWNDMNEWGNNIGQHAMPDMNSLLFWKDAAKRYKNHPAVLFGIYNEPHSVSWDVWKNGGEVVENVRNRQTKETKEYKYLAPGIQKIADIIRAQGAENILIIGGLDWGFFLDEVCNGYEIDDRGGNGIIYDSHVYPWKPLDWDKYTADVGAKYPIIIGEFGHYGDAADPREGKQVLKSDEWMKRILDWIDEHQYNFTAWDFHPSAGPCLIKNFDNEPTEYFGVYIKEYLGKR
ncbi:MAG: glycoside hydrolase family 5 protein [Oscillospiraceae bacterium]|nr:glycoside hydrolase family 5 protein [Oscillospiraceae bacterium]